MDDYRVKPGARLRLKDHDPDDTGPFRGEAGQAEAERRTAKLVARIAELHEILFARADRALLVVVQAMDGAGKDSTIKHVLGAVMPQGVRVTYFKAPTPLELSHDYLWRVHAALPPKGTIGIFNRSHYEDVLITRVHGWIDDRKAERRLEHIRAFEEMLSDEGTKVLKFYLHISKEEQRAQQDAQRARREEDRQARLEERRRVPQKQRGSKASETQGGIPRGYLRAAVVFLTMAVLVVLFFIGRFRGHDA